MKKLGLFLLLSLIMLPFSLAETADLSAPLINAINVLEIAKTAAKVIWTTDEPATSRIVYESNDLSSAELTTKHTVLLESLRPATLYYYNVTSCDAAGNCATASGKSLSFATIGYKQADPIPQQSNFTKSILNSVTKVNLLNFTEQNPIVLNLDSREGLYFIYNKSEYALIFPKQSELNTTLRLLPFNKMDLIDYGQEIKYDLNNDTKKDISFRIVSVKKTDVQSIDNDLRYVKYQFNMTITDLNKPAVNKTEEARVKFEQNPVYESKYEPPAKEGEIGVSSSILPERSASVFTGVIMAIVVFAATLVIVFLAKGN